MTYEIEPTKEQIDNWIKKYVPEKDLFFMGENDLNLFEEYLNEALVIPREEFFNHSSYKQIQLANSYEYWNISSKATYIIVAHSSWITYLPVQKKRDLLGIQVNMGRGLIFPNSLVSFTNAIPKEYIIVEKEENLVIQSDMWKKLDYTIKENIMKAYAQLWDNWTCYDVPEQTPVHIKRYANEFSIEAGSNCLSATLYAITEQDWMIREWVHPQTFLNSLTRANYDLINDEIKYGDVVTWINEDDVIQHASYHIGDNLFFNKNGQTFFNPWKITHLDQLSEEWKEYKMRVYRIK